MKGLKNIINSDAAYEILDNSSCAGTTWMEGGCAILAQALNKVEGYPMYVIFNKKYNGPEHFGVMTPSGSIIDGIKEYRNEFAWLEDFKANEFPREGELVVLPYSGGMDLNGIEFDEQASDRLAELINGHRMVRETVRDVLREALDKDYKSWKRKNVTIRGVKEVGQENNAGAMLGRGLYTAALSNKDLAKQYGKVHFVVGAIPKNPKVFNNLNEWEIWFYNTLVFQFSKEKGKEFPDKRDFNASTTIESEMQKLGYDGIIIKGREMVNFSPGEVLYFSNEEQLMNYYSGPNFLNEELLDETHTGQKDLENFTNKILKSLAEEVIKEKNHMVFLTDNKNEPITSFPIMNTNSFKGEGYGEIGDFVESTNIIIAPTKIAIGGKGNVKGELEYGRSNGLYDEYYKIWLKYSSDDIDEINQIFEKDREITLTDIYFKLYYTFYSTLLHEMQHAYDAYRSGGKAFSGQQKKDYVSSKEKADKLIQSRGGFDEMSPEEIEAVNKSSIAYLNLVHEINARFAQAMQKTSMTSIDWDTFDDVKEDWNKVYKEFQRNFSGWRHLSDKMKKKLARRVAKAYQEEVEKMKTAKQKYSKQDLEMVAENIQLADKVYFKTGKLSPRVREVIIDKITGGDPYTKIVTDIYYAILQDGHAVGDWAVRYLDDKDAKIDRTDKKIENDVLKIDDWKLVKSYYQQLKSYNKNVFPIKDYNINGVKDVMGLIRALRQRATILEKIQALPKIALSNMRADIRTPRDSNEMNNYRDRLEYFLGQYSLLSNREGRMKSVIDKKMFKSNITLEDLIDFADEKENLIGGKKLNKAAIKKIISENDDELQVVYEKGNRVVVEVTGPSGIKAIGCNSVWCFTYGPGIYRQGGDWEQNSTNDHVYVIIDFSEESDSPYFMYVLIKPLDFQSEADNEDGDQENDGKMADMSNQFTDNPLGVIYHFMTPEEAYMIFNFGEHRDGPTSKWPFENPNQLKLDLQEIRKMIRNVLRGGDFI